MTMNDSQRLQLQNMIKTNNVEDQTELIRNLKHSGILRNEVNNMIMIKALYRDEPDKLNIECINECGFLFTYYTEIFNKIKKDEIDISILTKFIDVLREIEEGTLDQHSGSFMVGTLLKELYIDSALKKSSKLDEEEKERERKDLVKAPVLEPKNVSWHEFKKMKKTRI